VLAHPTFTSHSDSSNTLLQYVYTLVSCRVPHMYSSICTAQHRCFAVCLEQLMLRIYFDFILKYCTKKVKSVRRYIYVCHQLKSKSVRRYLCVRKTRKKCQALSMFVIFLHIIYDNDVIADKIY